MDGLILREQYQYEKSTMKPLLDLVPYETWLEWRVQQLQKEKDTWEKAANTYFKLLNGDFSNTEDEIDELLGLKREEG